MITAHTASDVTRCEVRVNTYGESPFLVLDFGRVWLSIPDPEGAREIAQRLLEGASALEVALTGVIA